MKKHPHKLFSWLITIFCPPEKQEEVEGDLLEAFYWRLETKSILYAQTLFIYEVMRSSTISHFKPFKMLNQIMMASAMHLKTGWRFLKKNLVYSSINILGLALGISFSLLAWLFVNDETSYDKHLSMHHKLYRLVIDMSLGDNTHHIGGSSNAMSIVLADQVPEIATIIRLDRSNTLIRHGDEYLEQAVLVADSFIEKALDLTFLHGYSTFNGPNELWLSESMASKLSVDSHAEAPTISLNFGEGDEVFLIKGIYEDIPLNTSVHSDMIISFDYYLKHSKPSRLTDWFDINMNTLVVLKENADLTAISSKMNAIHKEKEPDMKAEVNLHLQPISATHLNSTYGHYNGMAQGGNRQLIWIFSCVGLLALIIAAINFTNFNVSLYLSRSKEVAIRKIVGSSRLDIFGQLMSEAALSVGLSGAVAAVILIGSLPFFGQLVSKSYTLETLQNPIFILGACGILFLITLFSGAYPALIFSKLAIGSSLKGANKIGKSKTMTQTLLALQFGITALLIFGMLTLHGQLKYLQNFDNKIDLEGVLLMDYIPNTDDQTIERFMTELSTIPGVLATSAISGYNGTKLQDESNLTVRHLRIENDLLELLDIQVMQGRNFDSLLHSDKIDKVLVNEAFVTAAALENPVGSTIAFEYQGLTNPKIIGVVEDYHFESAKSSVEPLVIYQSPQYPLQSVFVKTSSMINRDRIADLWQKYFSPNVLDVVFLQDHYNRAFEQEQRLIKLVGLGTVIAISLASLGLLGILGLQLSQKLKEISIRKVLGANGIQILVNTTKKVVFYVTSGSLLGLTAGYLLSQKWLLQYPVAINVGAEIIFYSALTIFILTGLSIFIQVYKTIRANPVKYLKDE